MNPYLRRSRISKALTDSGEAASFPDAERRLDAVRVAVALAADQAMTPAGQAATLTALVTARKCFGKVTLVIDADASLLTPSPLGASMVTAARKLGATILPRLPADTTHTVLIGNMKDLPGWVVRCW
jgi:hypothetical protein